MYEALYRRGGCRKDIEDVVFVRVEFDEA